MWPLRKLFNYSHFRNKRVNKCPVFIQVSKLIMHVCVTLVQLEPLSKSASFLLKTEKMIKRKIILLVERVLALLVMLQGKSIWKGG